ncbi:unnamed protein product [Closterium sp. NIES-65]|nr:unnamed protein product [Closterium sp. NIES-65]
MAVWRPLFGAVWQRAELVPPRIRCRCLAGQAGAEADGGDEWDGRDRGERGEGGRGEVTRIEGSSEWWVVEERGREIPLFHAEERGREIPLFHAEERGREIPLFHAEERGREIPLFHAEERGGEIPLFHAEERGREIPLFHAEERGGEIPLFHAEERGGEIPLFHAEERGREIPLFHAEERGGEIPLFHAEERGGEIPLFHAEERGREIPLFDAEERGGEIPLFHAEERGREIPLFHAEERGGEIPLFHAEERGGEIPLFHAEERGGEIPLFHAEERGGEIPLFHAEERGREIPLFHAEERGGEIPLFHDRRTHSLFSPISPPPHPPLSLSHFPSPPSRQQLLLYRFLPLTFVPIGWKQSQWCLVLCATGVGRICGAQRHNHRSTTASLVLGLCLKGQQAIAGGVGVPLRCASQVCLSGVPLSVWITGPGGGRSDAGRKGEGGGARYEWCLQGRREMSSGTQDRVVRGGESGSQGLSAVNRPPHAPAHSIPHLLLIICHPCRPHQ